MSNSLEADLRTRYATEANLEKNAVAFVDDVISSFNNGRVLISDVFKRLHYLLASNEIRNYIGYDPSSVAEFVECRRHLWRTNDGEEIHAIPSVLRLALVDLVAAIVKNRNRAPLSEIFGLMQFHHKQALPYLPSPTNGSSLDAVKNFILGFPNLFRLVNAGDGNEWTRTTPLGQVVAECVSVVVDGVILLKIPPVISTSSSSRSSSIPSQQTYPSVARGIAEIVRVTPAWGYLQSDTYGPIFFTSGACGNSNLHAKGMKLGIRVAFEANYCEDDGQMLNSVPVQWRAYNVRHLTPAERDAPDGLEAAYSTANENDSAAEAAVASATSGYVGQSISLASSASGFVSPSLNSSAPVPGIFVNGAASGPPKLDEAAMKRLPGRLAEWLKKRQSPVYQNQTTSPRQSPSAVTPFERPNHASETLNNEFQSTMQAIEDELDDLENGIECAQPNHSMNTGLVTRENGSYEQQQTQPPYQISLDPVPATEVNFPSPPRNQTTTDVETSRMRASVDNRPRLVDVAVQTDTTDEELLLRLLRTCPEILDMVRVVLRRNETA